MNDPFSILFICLFAFLIICVVGDFTIKYQEKKVEIWKLKKEIEKLKKST